MNRISAVARIQLTDKFSWVILPWLILLLSFVVNLVIGASLVDEDMYTGGLISIHIYMLVMGVISVTQTFPFAIGYTVRRTDYFLGTTAAIVGVSLFTAILLWLAGVIEFASNDWGIQLHFFHLPFISSGPALEQIAFHFTLMVCCFFIGFLFPSIYRRFGRLALFAFFVILFLGITVAVYVINYFDQWAAIGETLSQVTVNDLSISFAVIAVLVGLCSFLLQRRSTV